MAHDTQNDPTIQDHPTIQDICGDAHVRTAGLDARIDLPGYEEWLNARGDRGIDADDIAWADAMDRAEQQARRTSTDGGERSAA